MKKKDVLAEIIATLKSELAALTKAAQESFSAATDPDSKAENKYDTRSLEASYVARGQAQRVADIQQAVCDFQMLPQADFQPGASISLGALVCLEGSDGQVYYFLGPSAGGTEVKVDSCDVTVITPTSPLGQRLLGAKVETSVILNPGVSVRVSFVG